MKRKDWKKRERKKEKKRKHEKKKTLMGLRKGRNQKEEVN